MKRVWILLLAVAVALAIALPATAQGRPEKKPPKEPATYEVTMGFVDDADGLSTSLCGSEPIVMTDIGHNGMLVSEDAAIFIRASGVVWSRDYPDPEFGIGFNECHYPSVESSSGPYRGWLYIRPNAASVDFIWHFDYYVEGEWVTKGKNKKERFEPTVYEHLSMVATADYDPDTGEVSGKFPFSWYLQANGSLIHPQDRFEPEEGVPMKFTLTITTITPQS